MTETPTLTDFLLARIAEDEAEATAIQNPSEPVPYGCWDEDRVVAECAAKRRIVELATTSLVYGDESPAERDILAILALPYADHPDYREEWRP